MKIDLDEITPQDRVNLMRQYAQGIAWGVAGNWMLGAVETMKQDMFRHLQALLQAATLEHDEDGVAARSLLLAKGILVELDAKGVVGLGQSIEQFAEDVYRYCDKHHRQQTAPYMVDTVAKLMQNMSGDSPAIRRAKCYPV